MKRFAAILAFLFAVATILFMYRACLSSEPFLNNFGAAFTSMFGCFCCLGWFDQLGGLR